jgi:hypothetical protein
MMPQRQPAHSSSGTRSMTSSRTRFHGIRLFHAAGLFALFAFAAAPRALSQPDEYSAPELDWFTISTKHFTVNYHDGAERTARVVAKIAEEVYGPITSLYNHEPDSRVHLVMKDISDYSNGAAYFFNNKIEIWASPLDFELRGTHNWLRNVIAHEFTHIIQMQTSMKWGRNLPAFTLQWFGYEKERRKDVLYGFPNLLVSYPIPGIVVPPWMAEGTAQYNRYQFQYEHWDAHRDMILRCYALSDSMLSWAEMAAFGKTSLGNESVYNAGYNLTRYIAATYGEDAIVRITKAMSRPFVFTIDGAIRSALNISGKQLYREWSEHLRDEYARRIEPVRRNRMEGDLIADVGFGNLHPVFTPDGKKIAYISNKTSDYFGQTALYLYDPETRKEKMVVPGVRSSVSWSPDGKRVVYAKYNPTTVYGHLYYDLYEFDLTTEEERRLTTGLRAHHPCYSPDGTRIVFTQGDDGSVNLATVHADGTGYTAVTKFHDGEQAFTPTWTPDGSRILFGFARTAQRSIASIVPDGTGMTELVTHPTQDNRDPVSSTDGKYIYFSSDRTGIFNVYRYEIASKNIEQMTNTIGGAFMPAPGPDGDIAYAAYTASGYKIALLRHAAPMQMRDADYLPGMAFTPKTDPANTSEWDWDKLRSFDDFNVPAPTAKPYSRIFQSMMFFPTIRIDEYNPDNSGLQKVKPGLMVFSSDILNRIELLGSASINLRGERDLYLDFSFRDRLPILSSLELFPTLTLGIVNVTRKTSSPLALPLDTPRVDVGFNLLEFSARVTHNLFDSHSMLELGYRHSRYTSTLESFHYLDQPFRASDYLYFIGNDLSFALRHHQMVPARDGEINPAGLRLGLYYDYEFNRFNPNGDVEVDQSSGMVTPRYQHVNIHRAEATALIASRLPGWSHVLSVRLRGASILGPVVDDFFNFYAGGITGMQGYSYYALGGGHLYHANVTYRFPIIPRMNFSIAQLMFDKLYGGLFVDIGDAAAERSQMTLASMKRDVGFELRLETFSFALYPTRIFFSGAYGLTDFTRTFQMQPVRYGKEWRWYFGVLFGFDLSDKEGRGV